MSAASTPVRVTAEQRADALRKFARNSRVTIIVPAGQHQDTAAAHRLRRARQS